MRAKGPRGGETGDGAKAWNLHRGGEGHGSGGSMLSEPD